MSEARPAVTVYQHPAPAGCQHATGRHISGSDLRGEVHVDIVNRRQFDVNQSLQGASTDAERQESSITKEASRSEAPDGLAFETLPMIEAVLTELDARPARVQCRILRRLRTTPRCRESSACDRTSMHNKKLTPHLRTGVLGLGISEHSQLVYLLERQRPTHVVTCVSGSSTAWIALALERVGRGEIYALEHEEQCLRDTWARVHSPGVGKRVPKHCNSLKENTRGQGCSRAVVKSLPEHEDMVLDHPRSGQRPCEKLVMQHAPLKTAGRGSVIIDDTDSASKGKLVRTCMSGSNSTIVVYHEESVLLEQRVD